MHLSPRLFSSPHCNTTRIRNIKGILLISGLWPSSEVLPLSSDSPINPFAFLLLSLFSPTPQTWCSLSCQKFCIGIKLGVFCAKARSFQWQYCCRRLYLVKNILWELTSHVVFSPCGCRAFWNTKKHQFQIKQRHFICSTSTVYCPWK